MHRGKKNPVPNTENHFEIIFSFYTIILEALTCFSMFDVADVVRVILIPAYLACTLEETAVKHIFFKSGINLLYRGKNNLLVLLWRERKSNDICLIRVTIVTAECVNYKNSHWLVSSQFKMWRYACKRYILSIEAIKSITKALESKAPTLPMTSR